MPDQVQVDEQTGVIRVKSFGTVSKEDVTESIDLVREVLDETGISLILVDTTGQETIAGTTDLFNIFSEFPREFFLALLAEESQATARDIAFVETVGVNRGIPIKVFLDEETALSWLREQDAEL